MTTSAFDRILDQLREHGSAVRPRGDRRATAQCPAHEDRNPSLSVTNGAGQALLYCHAGCQTADILAALGMGPADLFDSPRGTTSDYLDIAGTHVLRTVSRTPDKRFRQRIHQKAAQTPLYRLPDVAAAVAAGQPVWLAEGEKDSDSLTALAGVTATTAPQGAGNFHLADVEPLRGAHVVAVVDRDEPGDRWAAVVAERVGPVAASLRFVRAAVGKDASDHLAAGMGLDAFEDHEPPKPSGGSDASEGSDGSEGTPGHRGIELPEDVREDGARLLDDVRAWLDRHVTVMRPGDLDVLVLWSAHTHLARSLYTSPRLQIDSPVPESGKTTVLEHLQRLTFKAVLASSISSPALLARLLEHEPRTLLLDEVDRTLDPKKEGVGELVAIINSGYKVGATRPTLVPVKGGSWEPRELSTFSPVVMAGNQPNLPDDTRTRIIRVLLLPDWSGRVEESDWELKEIDGSTLGARLARWSRHVLGDVRHRPELPAGVTGRFREKWLPLARVAHVAGGRWPTAVATLAADDVEQVRADRDAGLAVEKPAVLLLRHINEAWPADREFVATAELVDLLATAFPDAWGSTDRFPKGLTAQRFGRMLNSSYGIRSTTENSADKNAARGYRRGQFGVAVAALRRPEVRDNEPPESPIKPPERPEPPEPPEALDLAPDPPAPARALRAPSYGPPAVDPCPDCGDPLTGPGLLTRCRDRHQVGRSA